MLWKEITSSISIGTLDPLGAMTAVVSSVLTLHENAARSGKSNGNAVRLGRDGLRSAKGKAIKVGLQADDSRRSRGAVTEKGNRLMTRKNDTSGKREFAAKRPNC